jgi:two-component system cell cycle sensor histidine kinase/response regulator CckA
VEKRLGVLSPAAPTNVRRDRARTAVNELSEAKGNEMSTSPTAESPVPPVRILVVEDERIVAMSLRKQLQNLGYEVVGQASSGEVAVEEAEKKRPDLVLMDINLEGGMDGVEAANEIRRNFHIPVVYLTAYSNKEVLERAKITEPFGYILKPYEDRELHVVIETGMYKHRTEQTLRENERRYRTTLNSVGDGIIAIDSQGQVTFLNPVAERITGWKQVEAAGQALETVFPLHSGSDRASIPNPARAALRENLTLRMEPNCVLLTRDGREVSVEDCASPITVDDNPEVQGAVLAFRDVTDQRRAEAAVQQAQKLESLGLLAGGIAHDFNNLLMPILGYAELLKEFVSGDPAAVQMAEMIEKAAESAAQLTSQMLAYAGKGRFVIETLDLSLIVREMAALLSASVSKKAELRYDLGEYLPAIEADPAQVRQIVLNLLTNASEAFGEQTGVIHVSTRLVSASLTDLASRFVPETPAAGEYIVLEVSDNGCGMSDETLVRIFDPFFTTKFTGRGLGLAAVLGIVQSHRCTLKVRSTLGQGTTFEVFFPRSSQVPEAPRQESVQARPVKGTVLVADDEEAARTLYERTLSGAGLRVILVRDGQEAVDVFRQRQAEIGCVLLDLTMPRLDGIEVLAEIRQIAPSVPVVVMSGYSPEDLAVRFVGQALAGILQKPFRSGRLLDVIRIALEQSSK